MILTVESRQIPPDVSVLEMKGRIILGKDAHGVEQKVAELLREQVRKIIFDLTGVTLMDSTGVGILVVCQSMIKKEGGALRIAGANGSIKNTMKTTKVDKLLQMYPSVEEAAASF